MVDLPERGGRGRLPLTVIGGYLGAGKTTLLNRLLTQTHGVRLAVLVNDFGSVNVDADLIANRDGETIRLTNGCVCCSIGDDLAFTLHDLADRADGPDHIVVEASGVAEPIRLAGYAASHPRLALDAIVVVADAETIRTRADDKYVGDLIRLQLASADVVALSKTDLIDAEASRQVRRWIEGEVPRARILEAAQAGHFTELLFSGRAQPPRPTCEGAEDHRRIFATWTFTREQPLDGAALRAAIAALPPAVIRAKGFVSLAEAPGRRFVLQLVGARWSLEPEDAGTTPDALSLGRSVVVCIGLADQLDISQLATLFAPTSPPVLPPAVAALLQGEKSP